MLRTHTVRKFILNLTQFTYLKRFIQIIMLIRHKMNMLENYTKHYVKIYIKNVTF